MNTPDLIMIVDDDPLNNQICELIIKKIKKDMRVRIFQEPADALKAIGSEYSDPKSYISTVLLLDINMPDLDGWDFLDCFKNFEYHIQKQFVTYMVSSSGDPRDKRRAEESILVEDFVCKPLSLEWFRQILLNTDVVTHKINYVTS
jgi:two-component system chemotaxis response regulator CheY